MSVALSTIVKSATGARLAPGAGVAGGGVAVTGLSISVAAPPQADKTTTAIGNPKRAKNFKCLTTAVLHECEGSDSQQYKLCAYGMM